MQLNGKLRIVRGVRGILVAALFGLAGLFFAGLGIYLLINPSAAEAGSPNNGWLNYLFIGVGVLVAVVSIIMIVRTVITMKKNAKPLTEEEVKANEAQLNINAPHIENLKDTKLFFHFYGKLNQSYVAEDRDGQHKYEINLKKFNPIGANTFEFVDVDNHYSKMVKVGKTLTTSSEGGMMFVGDTLTSRFKIDGVQSWDYLRQRGYEIKHFLFEKGITHYELYKLNKLVATILPCDIKNPWDDTKKNILRMNMKSVFRLEIVDCKLEDVAIAAFIISQSEMVE